MVLSTAQAIERWGPLQPYSWPQDQNDVPSAGGLATPHVEQANAQRSKREAFTYAGTFNLPNTIAVGQQLTLNIQTDTDGDFWCDQIYMVGWGLQLTPRLVQSGYPIPGALDIVDLRTGLSLTYPAATCPTTFFSNLVLFSDDTGFDAGGSPYPDGFRSTSLIAQPFCFTRAGGMLVTLTSAVQWAGAPGPNLTDIAFGGWKEYEFASS